MDVSGLGPLSLNLRISFTALGFTFLIPNKVVFSLWFLNLVSFAFRSVVTSYRLGMVEDLGIYGAAGYPIMAHQGTGAMIVFVLSSLWFSRRHLKRVFRCALGVGDEHYDDTEPSSYRTALLVLILSLVVMVVWLHIAGLALHHSLILILVAMLFFFGLTRVVAQCGVPTTLAPMIAPAFMASTFGGAAFKGPGITALCMSWNWCSDVRTSVMASSAHGMYLARKKAGGLLWVLFAAAAVTFITATVWTIWLCYRYGAAGMQRWFFCSAPEYTFNWGLNHLEQGGPPNYQGYFWTGVGAGIMIILTVAHRALSWWPLHPVGFIICSVNYTDYLWFTFFLAWLAKFVILRVGGKRVFSMARKFFVGMVVGYVTAAGIWAIVDMITNKTNNLLYYL